MAKYFVITGIPISVGQDPPPRLDVASWAISSEPVDQFQAYLYIRCAQTTEKFN
jgi:hypothetical protein